MKSLWMLISVEDELVVVKIAKVTSLPAFPNNDTQLKSFIPI